MLKIRYQEVLTASKWVRKKFHPRYTRIELEEWEDNALVSKKLISVGGQHSHPGQLGNAVSPALRHGAAEREPYL